MQLSEFPPSSAAFRASAPLCSGVNSRFNGRCPELHECCPGLTHPPSASPFGTAIRRPLRCRVPAARRAVNTFCLAAPQVGQSQSHTPATVAHPVRGHRLSSDLLAANFLYVFFCDMQVSCPQIIVDIISCSRIFCMSFTSKTRIFCMSFTSKTRIFCMSSYIKYTYITSYS